MPALQNQICSVPGCGRKHKARGYCEAHYQHFKRGVPIKTEIVTRDRTVYEHCTEPECSNPVKSKGLCFVHYARLLRHGHTKHIDRTTPPKPCSIAGCENHVYAKMLCHQHYARKRRLKEKYGLTPQQETEMLATQNGVCAICGGMPRKIDPRSGKLHDFNVDHSHVTNAIRGLLCSHCNRALGLFGDSLENLRRAVSYLEKYSLPDSVIPQP